MKLSIRGARCVLCECASPWTGADCSVQPCPNECSHRGVCHGDKCYCPAGYTDDACQTKVLAAKWARTSRYGTSAALTPDANRPVESIDALTGLNAGPSTRHAPGVATAVEASTPPSGGRVFDFAKLGRTAFLQMGMGRAPPEMPAVSHEGLEGLEGMDGLATR